MSSIVPRPKIIPIVHQDGNDLAEQVEHINAIPTITSWAQSLVQEIYTETFTAATTTVSASQELIEAASKQGLSQDILQQLAAFQNDYVASTQAIANDAIKKIRTYADDLNRHD